MKTLLLSAALLSAPLLRAAEPFEVFVVADRVNLRNQPTLESDVVGQVNYGDTLSGLELSGEWIRVQPPESIPVWVHGGLLFEDREVRAPVLNIRNGPGTQFSILGQLQRTDPVTVIDRYDDWRRIEATPAVTIWIHRELVQLPSPPEPTPEPAPEPTPTDPPAPSAPTAPSDPSDPTDPSDPSDPTAPAPPPLPPPTPAATPTPAPEPTPEPVIIPPADVDLVPLEGQGTASVRRGWVKAYLIAGSAPSRFQLVYHERGQELPLAYLRGDEATLRPLVGKNVLVRGRDFWVTGQRLPLTRIDTIEGLPEPTAP